MLTLKKSLFLISAFFFLTGISSAQEFHYGLGFGLSKSAPIFNNELYNNSSSSEISYNVMALVDFPTNSYIRVQTGLKFFKVGYSVDLDIRTFTGPAPKNYSSSLSFVAIPLNLNYLLPFFSNAYLCGGMEGAYLLAASSNVLYEDNSTTDENISNQVKDFHLFFTVGFGIDYSWNKIILFARPEYTRSVFEVSDKSSFASDYRIESFVLNVGIKF